MPSRLLAAGLLALVAATWKLWTPQDVFPQVPLIRAACDWPGWFDWVCLAVLVASSLTLLIVARGNISWGTFPTCPSANGAHPAIGTLETCPTKSSLAMVGRMASAAMALSLAGFFVLDQHRLQPWAWQFFLLAVLLSLADDTTARRGWRWLVIGIYFWSAVSKLDYTFCHEQGPALLGGLKQAMGLHGMPNRWTKALDVCNSLGIALGELSVAVLLAWPRARWLGLWTATIMHVSLLAALGPLGLNHSLGVLFWNVFFICQNWLLFREPATRQPSPDDVASPRMIDRFWRTLAWPPEWSNRLALGILTAAMTWPVLEPVGLCDHWLAWAVYSARADGCEVSQHSQLYVIAVPASVRPYVVRHHVGIEFIDCSRFNLAGWSLDGLDVPIYPQNRFHIGVCLALLNRCNPESPWWGFYAWEPPSRWSARSHGDLGRGWHDEHDLEDEADTFYWNAHPRLTTFGLAQKNPSP